MKKLFFIAAIAGAALVSCTKNELAPSATEQHEITFASPVTSTLTKAALVTDEVFPTDIPFFVYADYHTKDFNTAAAADFTPYMNAGGQGVMVEFSKATTPDDPNVLDYYWTTNKKYYWPMDGKLSFYAYSFGKSGYNTTFNAGYSYSQVNGLYIPGYTVETDLTNQVDLMLSKRATDQTKASMVEGETFTPNGVYDGVQIQFNHALSAIKFAANTDKDYTTDGYTISIKSLTVKNAYTTADLTQFAGLTKDYDASTIWSEYKTEDNYVAFTSKTAWEVPYATTATAVSSEDADLILLPQALDHGTNDVVVEIVYTVQHDDMGKGNSIEYTKNFPLTVSATDNKWLAGKRYIYTIIFGMEEIKFAPVIVADWADVELDINVPEDEIN